MIQRLFAVAAIVVAFVGLTLVVNAIHFRYFIVDVVLYDAMLDALLAGVALSLLYVVVLRRRLPVSGLEFSLSATIGVLLSAFYALSVPTVIDRSLSFYILEKLDQRGGGIRQDAMADVFRDEYMPEHHLVDVRLTEQLNSGTIRIVDGCVVLTPFGQRVAAFSRFYRQNLLPKRREIMGDVTDALTDPFRQSKQAGDYECSAPTAPSK